MVLGMPSVRSIVRAASTVSAAGIISPVVGEWFVKLAEERGLYEEPSSHVERAMTWLASWTQMPGFGWVAGLLVGFAAGVWVDALLRRRERRAEASAQSGTPALANYGIYVGRIHIDANRLMSDYLLEFAVIAHNATGSPLKVAGVSGVIAYGPTTATPDAALVRLPAPALREDGPPEIAPKAEFMVIVSQHVPGALAAEMERDLAAGSRVMFVLEGLDVSLVGHTSAKPMSVPLWSRVSCDRAGKMTVTFPIITGQMNCAI